MHILIGELCLAIVSAIERLIIDAFLHVLILVYIFTVTYLYIGYSLYKRLNCISMILLGLVLYNEVKYILSLFRMSFKRDSTADYIHDIIGSFL